MAVTEYSWAVEAAPIVAIAPEIAVSPFDRAISLGNEAHLGFGLLRPFVRDQKNDFANAGGLPLVKSAVGQVLGTRSSNDFLQGELPWDTDFGSLLYTLRHIQNDDDLQELARLHVVEALQRWEPRMLLTRVDIARKETADGGENILEIFIVYDLIQEHVHSNQVILPDVEAVFQIAI